VPIERATDGEVTRRDLRPADWGDIWPELIDALHPWPPRPDVIDPTVALPLRPNGPGQAFAPINLGPLPHHAANDSTGAPAPEAA
jgi:hypothetical protein